MLLTILEKYYTNRHPFMSVEVNGEYKGSCAIAGECTSGKG